MNASSTLRPRSLDVIPAERKLVADLRAAVGPLAAIHGAAVGYTCRQAPLWIGSNHAPETCPCRAAFVQREPAKAGRCRSFIIDWSPRRKGAVLVCCCRIPDAEVASALVTSVGNLLRLADHEVVEQGLLKELSECWERLESIYDLIDQMDHLPGLTSLFEKILVAAAGPERNAGLWLKKDDEIVSCASLLSETVGERVDPGGIVARCLERDRTSVIQDPERIARSGDKEFAGANAVVATPIRVRGEAEGVLAIWSDSPTFEVDVHLERLAQTFARQAGLLIEHQRLLEREVEAGRIRRDMEIGGVIQQTLLSDAAPTRLRAADVGTHHAPSQLVDGDFHLFHAFAQDALDVLVGDVMGKGVPAALIGAAAKTQYLRSLAESLACNGGMKPEPAAVIEGLHHKLVDRLIQLGSFITVAFARFDFVERKAKIIDCGHPPIMHRRADGSVDMVVGENMPLGFSTTERYAAVERSFEPGDAFVFVSDGILEATDLFGNLYGPENLAAAVSQSKFANARELAAAVFENAVQFQVSRSFRDDATIVAVCIGDVAQCSGATSLRRTFEADLKNLHAIREAIAAAMGATWDDDARNSLLLAATEGASNVIRHAYCGESGVIDVEVEADADLIVVRLRDDAKPYVPSDEDLLLGDEPQPSGMGLHLIMECVDEATFERDAAGRNCLTLVMRRKGASNLEQGEG